MILEDVLMKEFDWLKDNYRRCIRKREQATRSGAGQKKLPTCDFFGELSFLRDVMTSRKSENNIEVDLTLDDSQINPPAATSADLDKGESQPEVTDSKAIQKARKQRSDQIDDLLAISLVTDLSNARKENINTNGKKMQQDDQDVLFCSSLVESFKNLEGKKNKLSKDESITSSC